MSIRDLLAAVIAVLLLFVAMSLTARLQAYRRRRDEAFGAERALGRHVIAEIPTGEELQLFSEDGARFYFGDRSIDKDLIKGVRLLVNGSPIAAQVSHPGTPTPRSALAEAPSPRSARDRQEPPTTAGFNDQPDGIMRDRWDVAIDTERGTVLIECGAIRERVSQEMARKIFDAVKADLERRDG